MRGKVDIVNKMYGTNRITPAYAGKSCVGLSGSAARADHPRVCGEKVPKV